MLTTPYTKRLQRYERRPRGAFCAPYQFVAWRKTQLGQRVLKSWLLIKIQCSAIERAKHILISRWKQFLLSSRSITAPKLLNADGKTEKQQHQRRRLFCFSSLVQFSFAPRPFKVVSFLGLLSRKLRQCNGFALGKACSMAIKLEWTLTLERSGLWFRIHLSLPRLDIYSKRPVINYET